MVFEDIHWAEEPLLELIDHLAQWVRERALLILCLARPELLDVRPGWGGGRVRSTAIELEPLGREDSEALADALLEEHQVQGRCARASSTRPRAIRCSWRRRCGCCSSKEPTVATGSPIPSRR